MDSMELYNKIIRIARKKNMTEPQLYKKAGISNGTLRSWKKNGSVPSLYVLEGLCFALDISLAMLFSEENFEGLSSEHRELIELWDTLDKEQKDVCINIMKTFKKI